MQKEQGFALKCKDGIVSVAFADLEYVEVINKTVFFYLTDGNVYEATAALLEFEGELLRRSEFIKTHRSYLINLSCVQSVSAHCARTKNGHSVPISRQRRGLVQDAFLKFLHQTKDTVSSAAEDGVLKEKQKNPNGPWQILLVDDDISDRAYWAEILKSHGCMIHLAENGREAVCLAKKEYFDLVLLDVMLPEEDGFLVCERLRTMTGAPVIFLSCLTESDKQLEGFASGGIDYITKDTPAELFWAKVKTRITLAASDSVQMKFGSLLLDITRRKAFVDGKELLLTSIEFDILWRISEHAGRIFTPEEIFDMVFLESLPNGGQTAQIHMSRLRKKLDAAQKDHCFIETVWGQGYRFVPPVL